MRFVARIVNGAATLLLVVALLALCGLAATILMGLKPGVVKTGSMRPMLAPGTLIIVKPTLAEKLKIGDVITFTDPDSPAKGLVTHRIYKIEHEKGQPVFTTKGDANPTPDTWRLKLQKDAGLLKHHVANVGHLSFLVRTKQGYMLLLGIPVLLLSLSALIKIWTPAPEIPEPESETDLETDSVAMTVVEAFGYPIEIPDRLPEEFALAQAPPGEAEEARSA